MGKKEVRIRAEEWFIENQTCTQAEVAEMFNVTPKTVSGWAAKYEWDQKRLDYHSSPVRIKTLLQQELMSIAQGKAPKLDADAISKLNKALDRLDTKLNPFAVKKVLTDLDVFISKIDPEFAVKCTPFHKQFLIHKINMEVA